MADKHSEQLFLQRLEELADRCVQRFCPEFTHFLDAASLKSAENFIKAQFNDVLTVECGGFADAERKVLGFSPRMFTVMTALMKPDFIQCLKFAVFL